MVTFKKLTDERNIEIFDEDLFHELHHKICTGKIKTIQNEDIVIQKCSCCTAFVRKAFPMFDIISCRTTSTSFYSTLPEKLLAQHGLLERIESNKKDKRRFR